MRESYLYGKNLKESLQASGATMFLVSNGEVSRLARVFNFEEAGRAVKDVARKHFKARILRGQGKPPRGAVKLTITPIPMDATPSEVLEMHSKMGIPLTNHEKHWSYRSV